MIDVKRVDLEGFMGSQVPVVSLTDYAVELYVHIDDVQDLITKLTNVLESNDD